MPKEKMWIAREGKKESLFENDSTLLKQNIAS